MQRTKLIDGPLTLNAQGHMKNFLLSAGLAFLVFCGKKPEPIKNVAAVEKYVQVKDGLNVRETPDLKGKRIATLPNGTRVIILETKPEAFKVGEISGSWAKISYGKIQGWAFDGFLSSTEPAGDSSSRQCEDAKADGRREYQKCVVEARAENERLCPIGKANCEPVAPSSACGAPEMQIEQKIKKICGDAEPVNLR